MSKFQDYVPQPFAIYKMLALAPDPTRDYHYQNHRLSQCNGDITTWRSSLPFDGTKIGLPPFMVRRAAGGASITDLSLIRVDGATLGTLTVSSSIEALDDTSTWEAVIFASQSFTITPVVGVPYFMKFNDGTNYWYTDAFYFELSGTISGVLPFSTIPTACGAEEWIQLVWSNPACVISEIFPSAGTFMLNLAANVSRPKYLYKSDTEDNGEGGVNSFFHRLEKRWTFFVLAPEYIADALSAMQMFSDVGVNFQYGDTMNCRDLTVEVDWKTPCFADVTVSFTTDFLARTACCQI